MPDFSLENQHAGLVCGIDEAGRGPWAGPVVAACVYFDQKNISVELKRSLNDSKKLSPKKREALFEPIKEQSSWAIGMATVQEIDEINILQATFLAMERAYKTMPKPCDFTLIDGNKIPPALKSNADCVIKGDGLSCSIAAASILAKVTRDQMMAELAAEFPHYAWEKNAGYGTKAHQEGLAEFGITPHHRRSFAPIRKILES